METNIKLKNVVQCLVEGTLSEKLCRLCLSPLDEFCENIYSAIFKDGDEYNIAIILEAICGIKIAESENCCVCSDCFATASTAYKFYMTCSKSEEILDFYLGKLESNLDLLDTASTEELGDSICISLPLLVNYEDNTNKDFETTTEENNLENEYFQDDVSSIAVEHTDIKDEEVNYGRNFDEVPVIKQECNENGDEEYVILFEKDNNTLFYRTDDLGNLYEVKKEDGKLNNSLNGLETTKPRKKRLPMSYKSCSKCPVKYRFTSKLKAHMKSEHGLDLFICKICKATTEDKLEYYSHLQMHTNVYTCAICGTCFKKRSTMISHLQKHEETDNPKSTEGAHVCEICGQVLPSDIHLKEHYDKKHDKKYTCYYCGRSYKSEVSFESHIKKHEEHVDKGDISHQCQLCSMQFTTLPRLERHLATIHSRARVFKCSRCDRSFRTQAMLDSHAKVHDSNFRCETCQRDFVDARALLWHQRLHDDVLPYVCEVCGRAFVSANRRNAHAICAHTAPTRRCPLCPALFHMRSTVNSHIRKVHLKSHKRRFRSPKQQQVFWRTEPVPLQELSVAVQNDLLELQTERDLESI